MRVAALALVVVALFASGLTADDHSVSVDEDVDFAIFKTFMLSAGRMRSDRAELNFPAVMSALGDVIRTALRTHGLAEAAGRADLIVEHSVTGVDYSIGPFGRANIVRPGRRGSPSPGPVDFTEAILVIDLKRSDSGALVWRGVYYDAERDPRKLAEALPKDAAKLVSAHWPKRKK